MDIGRPIAIALSLLLSTTTLFACPEEDPAPVPDTTVSDADVAPQDTVTDTAPEVAVDVVDDTSGTSPPAYTFEPCTAVSSTDIVPTGIFEFVDGCVGYDALEPLKLLCAETVMQDTPTPFWVWSGPMVITATTYARIYSVAGTGTAWMPQTCVDDLGDGTCAELETLVLTLAPGAEASCTANAEYGGCSCQATGTLVTSDAGTWEPTPGATKVTYVNTKGEVVVQTYNVADGGNDMWSVKGTFDGALDLLSVGRYDGAASDCRIYCAHFVAHCNDLTALTPYTDYAECLTECAGFTTTGEAQPVTSGDSLECRTHHVMLSVDPGDVTNWETHCPHAQATATAPCVD